MTRDFWPVILRTEPPIIMTREEAYAKVPYMHVTYIPATNPHPDHNASLIPPNHRRSHVMS